MIVSDPYGTSRIYEYWPSRRDLPASGICSIIPWSEQIATLNRYIEQAKIASEIGKFEQKQWTELVEKQAKSIEVVTGLCDLFSSQETRKFVSSHNNVEDLELFGKKGVKARFGEIGGIEKNRDLGYRMHSRGLAPEYTISGGACGSFIAAVKKQVWDASTDTPVLLMESTNEEGLLSKDPYLLQSHLLYPIASLFSPHYSSASVAKTCFDNMASVDRFFSSVFFENPVDISRTQFRSYINQPEIFNNACWVSRNRQGMPADFSESLRFGKNSSDYGCFASNFSILAHESAHSIIDCAGGLEYSRQPGALNESIADAFAIMADHYQHRTLANSPDANWLIGEGIRKGAHKGTALRSLKSPGSAFKNHCGVNDLGVGHMNDFHYLPADIEPHPIDNDHGYVHTNCGIPNRAFYEASIGIGGYTYDKPGRIWHRALFSTTPNDTFSMFAKRTLQAIRDLRYHNEIYNIVGKAWRGVGIDLRDQGGCNLL